MVNLLRQWVASGPRMAVLRIGNEEWTVPVCRGDTADVVARMLASAMNERGAEERELKLRGAGLGFIGFDEATDFDKSRDEYRKARERLEGG